MMLALSLVPASLYGDGSCEEVEVQINQIGSV